MIDPNVMAMIDQLDALGQQRDDAWQIPRDEGAVLYNIAVAANATRIVEIGTSYGFSGLWWGAALLGNDGRLHTIDVNPKKYESARLTFAKAGLNQIITNHLGDAREVLASLAGPFDIAFIDADKPSTQAYFDLVWPKLRVGGSVLTDNASTHRRELHDFVHHVRTRPDAHSTQVPVGNGIEWTIKLR
jgi:predicted O-methyltransferase YrrM